MSVWFRSGLLITILLFFCIPGLAADDVDEGSDQGWYVIHCNVQLAKVYLDDKYVGETQGSGGTLTVPVYVTGSPPKILRVQKYGYAPFVTSIDTVPTQGKTVDLYTTLNELADTTQTSVGGDVGWYVVHCNIDGATVMFDASNKGEIARGVVYVPFYSTGTPYARYTVSKEGYKTYTADIADVPGKGETIDLYATLNPVATTVTTTTLPTKIGGDVGWYTVHCNIDGAAVAFDNDAKGQIVRGNLSVKVYTTGTPYKTFTVYKQGYVPYTGTIDTYPTKGETIDLYATLNAQSGTNATPVSTQKSPLAVWTSGLAVIITVIAAQRVEKK